MNVSNLMSDEPEFIALLSSKLDKESRTIGDWRSLARKFGIKKQKTEQFGLRGSGPTGALFLHISVTKGLRDLTMGELREHFVAMERIDLVNVLEKDYNYEVKGNQAHQLSSNQLPKEALKFCFLFAQI